MEKDTVPSDGLIAEKKGDEMNNGGGTSGEVKVYESKKKKRHRWEPSDSESSEDLLNHQKGNKNSSGYLRTREGTEIDTRNGTIDAESGRKRSKLDVFEYNDDYDWTDDKEVKRPRLDVRVTRSSMGGSLTGPTSLKSNEKQRGVQTEDKGSPVVEKGKRGRKKKRFEMTEDGTFRPVVPKIEKSGVSSSEPVGVQGENGVLKGMQKNKKKVESEGTRKSSRSANISKRKAPPSPPLRPEKKNQVNSRKSSKKEVRNKEEKTSISKSVVSVSPKDGKVKRAKITEKQAIREKIKTMLIAAGWRIELRQRMSKDYQDAVYICPKGTVHWSVVKAYFAHKKQCEEGDNSFSPIPEEELSKLFRETVRKIEREMKVLKEKADGGEESASLMLESMAAKLRMRERTIKKTTKIHKPNLVQGRKLKKQQGGALLVRNSKKGVNPDDDGFILYSGKRSVLSWLIDMGTVPLNGKVQYMNRRGTQAMLEGRITGDGIHCGCCSKILTVLQFEIHAGSKLRQPFQNIFVESGVSLFQCQLDAWNKQKESDRSGFHSVDVNGDDPNDDTCGICGDGGDLICCDSCPSTFHQSCLDIQMLPQGDWNCPNCSCKFCGLLSGSTCEGDDTAISELLTCILCEQKYHNSCDQEKDSRPVKSINSFCGVNCRKLFKQVQKLLGVKHELEGGFSYSLIRRSDLDSKASSRGLSQKTECNSKLAVALTIMDECFLPIVDQRSGINLIHNVLYNCGSNFNRLNYSGFYTAILERGDEIISAATIRIHGTRFAEMPFIGTRHIYRRQGMCRRLLYAIESVLCSLNVERLIIPAISELKDTWTGVFGFKPLEGLHKKEMRSFNMLVFPGTGLLQKLPLKQNLTEENVTDGSAVKAIEDENSHQSISEETNKSDIGSTVEPDVCASDKGVIVHAHEVNNAAADVETVTEASGDLAYDASDVSNQVDVAHVPVLHAPGEEPAPGTKFLSSGVTDHNKLGVEDGHISISPCDSAYDASDVSNEVDISHGPVLHAPGEESAPDTEFRSSKVTPKGVTDHADEVNDVVADIETVTEASGDLVYDASDASNQVDVAHRSILHVPIEEFAPDSKFLSSGLTGHNKLEVDDRLTSSPVKTKLQSSTRDSACDTISGTEPDLHSLAETTVEHTTNTTCEFQNSVLSIDGSPVLSI